MKKTLVCLSLVALMGLSGQAMAVIGTVDAVPAATLLLPYFEVDLDDPNGITTLFSINNASDAAAIAHVTLWTDLSIETIDFNVFLTGYDVVTFNLRDLFINGILPATQHQNLPSTPNSPRGAFSLDNAATAAAKPGWSTALCADQLPIPPLPAVFLDFIQRAHTGQSRPAAFGGNCVAVDHGDNVARGYITIDNANFCSLAFPNTPGYFGAGGTGHASNVNQLWGDYFYIDIGNNFAQGETLVHVEADGGLGAGNYTFYRRYTNGEDQREGLGSTFATRYVDNLGFPGGTSLQVWRDAKRPISAFSCALIAPSPYPLGHDQIVIFDEQENPDIPAGFPISPPPAGEAITPFPWEAQRTEVGGSAFPVPFDFGWLYLNLNTLVTDQTVPFGSTMQNWVTAVMDADGRFSVGFNAIQLDNVTFPAGGVVVVDPPMDLCLGEFGAGPC